MKNELEYQKIIKEGRVGRSDAKIRKDPYCEPGLLPMHSLAPTRSAPMQSYNFETDLEDSLIRNVNMQRQPLIKNKDLSKNFSPQQKNQIGKLFESLENDYLTIPPQVIQILGFCAF